MALAWLALPLAANADEPVMVVLDPGIPVADITRALEPISPPKPRGGGNKVDLSDRPFLTPDNRFADWTALRLSNPSTERIERLLVFSHPVLSRAGLLGADNASPGISLVRYVEGRMPTELSKGRAANRFGVYRVVLDPGEAHILAFKFENGQSASALRIWDPETLRDYEGFLSSLVGLFWGLLLASTAILFSMRVLSQAPATFSGGFMALSALVFEAASHGFSAGGLAGWFGSFGWADAVTVRALAIVMAGFFGLQFIRSLLSLHDEAPFVDASVRIIQYTLLAALPVIFLDMYATGVARAAVGLALLGAAVTVWATRYHLPDGLQLVPPGFVLLASAGLGVFVVGGIGIHTGDLIVEPILHGVFVVGTVLLVFAAAVRAAERTTIVEAVGHAHTPAFLRANQQQKEPERSLVPVAETDRQLPALAEAPRNGTAYQGLWDWTIDGDRLYVSPAIEAMMGLEEGTLGQSEREWEERVVEADKRIYTDTLRHYLAMGNSSFALEFRIHHKDGGHRWVNLRATGIAGEDGQAARCIGIVTDITAAKAAEEKLVHEASHDSLTRVGNRALMMSHIDWAIGTYREAPVTDPATGKVQPPALIVLDLDRFRAINDGLGHSAGDELLIEIAGRISKAIGPRDSVARIGSDEFAVLVLPPDSADEKTAAEDPEAMASLLIDVVSAPHDVADQTVYPSVSAGIARIGDQHAKAQDVLADAEAALKRAKRHGGGEAEAFSGGGGTLAPSSRAVQSISLETDLRQAIDRGEMQVLFQPIMRLSDGAVAGFEALLRWRHPKRGEISPSEFVPIAEETGMIVTIGRFALSMAALQLDQWQRLFPLNEPLFVTVNVSSRQLLKDDIIRDVGNALDSMTLAPGTLKLELTESMVFDNEDEGVGLLQRLNEKGVGLALDDFGTGFSSLSRLKSAPFSVLKIDQSFIEPLGQKDETDTIVRSTITMAHGLGIEIVAEGVETEAQVRALHELGCDLAQGFLFGEALPPADAQRFIAMNWKQTQSRRGLPSPGTAKSASA